MKLMNKKSIELQSKLDILTNGNYKLKSEYIGYNDVIFVEHDGITEKITPNKLMIRFRKGNKASKNTDTFKKEVYNICKEEYSVLGEYVNNSTKIEMKHNTCGHIYKVRPNDFQQGYRCPICSHRSYKKTTKEFKKEVFDLVGKEYKVVSEYKTCDTKIRMEHVKCGNIYEVRPTDFIKKYGNRCPFCNESKGEKFIKDYLDKYKIPHEHHHKIEKCRYKSILEFDFMIPLIDNKILLIEYDGRFHYEPFSNKESHVKTFREQQKRDKVKNEFCQKNNISLIRIPYFDYDNLEEILGRTFNDYRNHIDFNQWKGVE